MSQTGLTVEQTEEAAWAVTPDGTKYRGAAGISVCFDALIGIGRVIYWTYRIPGIRQVEDAVYAYVAKNRMFFSRYFGTTPAVKQEAWKPER